MDLRRRLAELDRTTRRAGEVTAASAPVDADARRDGLTSLGLAPLPTSAGTLWVREVHDAIGAPPARVPDLSGFFTCQAQLCPDPPRVLFLDTETTGLAGGTGTIPFLVGASWWRDDGLVTRQHFLSGPGQEAALLSALAHLAEAHDVVVTYNGASFDLPLLRTRSLLNRCPDPLAHLAGWDLLVPARRLWGNRLPDCRQQTVEMALDGRPRGSGDIEGARIPQTWFDFLTSGDVGGLANVLTHNRRDMVGMARIWLRIVETALNLNRAETGHGVEDWREAWALGRIAERRRDRRAAAAFFRLATTTDPVEDAAADRRFLADAVRNLKRGADWDLVERVIRAGLSAGVQDGWLHREAAMLYEHRLGRPGLALQHARRAGDAHREARLVRRLERVAGDTGTDAGRGIR